MLNDNVEDLRILPLSSLRECYQIRLWIVWNNFWIIRKVAVGLPTNFVFIELIGGSYTIDWYHYQTRNLLAYSNELVFWDQLALVIAEKVVDKLNNTSVRIIQNIINWKSIWKITIL